MMYICSQFSFFSKGLITFLVPCYTQGKNAEATGESCLMHGIYSIIPCIGWYCHATTRGKIRDKKNIDVSLTVHTCKSNSTHTIQIQYNVSNIDVLVSLIVVM